MALHGCLRFLKYLVFLLNFVVWLAGMGVLGLAIYLRMDPQSNHFVRAAYADEINIYHITCYLFIGAGVAVTFIGFLGCCGAFQESRCMLGTFFTFLILIFAAEVAGGVWAYIHRHELEETAGKTFKYLVHDQYGTRDQGMSLIDESVDFVQRTLKCCGGEKPSDWSGSVWEKKNTERLSKVPDSCCAERTIPKGFQDGVCGVSGAWRDGLHPGVWQQGCGGSLVHVIQEKLYIVVSAGLGIAGIQFMSLIFSIILCCGMRRQSAGGYKSIIKPKTTNVNLALDKIQ